MHTILYFSLAGCGYETQAYSTADIAHLVHDRGLQCLTSADRQFDFWFTPSPRGCQRRVNRLATELFMATTTFTPRNVPLLRGGVVVATHDSDGELDGLSWEQLDRLVEHNRSVTDRDERIVRRRTLRAELRRVGTKATRTPLRAAGPRPLVRA
jgi:hypothetical protein